MSSYCLKCRKNTEIKNPKAVSKSTLTFYTKYLGCRSNIYAIDK